MSLAYVVNTVVAALMAGFTAVSAYMRGDLVAKPAHGREVPAAWLPWLGAARAAGGKGLFVTLVGYAAGVGLSLYFTFAVMAVMGERWFEDVPDPLVFMAPVVGALVLAS